MNINFLNFTCLYTLLLKRLLITNKINQNVNEFINYDETESFSNLQLMPLL
jgi:hypothetical protein